jgi:short-subunit dehydrogenase
MKKVILVTGASSGIGKATALKLIQEGSIVYGAARRVESMKELETAGGHAIKMDVTVAEDVKNCVAQVIKEQGKIDVLVNNAGYAIYGPVEEISIDEARQQFEVNIFGLAAITQEVIPHMRQAGSGQIINISSIGGKIYTPLGAWYHATKHALEGWSDCLRLELTQFGIDVVIVEPGLIRTEFGDVLYDSMIKRSGNGVYGKMVKLIGEATKSSYDKAGNASPPSVIGDVIHKITQTTKPKTRYAAGQMAKMLLTMRSLLSDKLFDKAVMSQVKGM